MMKKTALCGFGAAMLIAMPALAGVTTQYTNRAIFEGTLGNMILDDFQAAGYLHGDLTDTPTLDIHTNASMSGVLGETDFFTTGFGDWNFITGPDGGDKAYCAGCNGSFELGFMSTSVGTPSGVFGVGFDIDSNNGYYAYVTFANGDTLDVALASGASFWGITSNLVIQSIHLGLSGGGSTTGGYFTMDNLTIGDAIPAPGVLAMLGVAGLAARRRRRR